MLKLEELRNSKLVIFKKLQRSPLITVSYNRILRVTFLQLMTKSKKLTFKLLRGQNVNGSRGETSKQGTIRDHSDITSALVGGEGGPKIQKMWWHNIWTGCIILLYEIELSSFKERDSKKDFWPKVNIIKGNYCILWINIVGSSQTF